jgi:quercetin dioxygenase-like cupin family protein
MIFLVTLLVMPTAALGQSHQNLSVTATGSQPSTKGSANFFTGNAWIDSRFQASEPGRVRGATVTFEPGARTAWHKHPLGQTLIIVSGIGWVQNWNGPVLEVTPGDVVWIPPGVKHWHGASASNGMSHIAIGEMLDGNTVEWLEHVTEDQYGR